MAIQRMQSHLKKFEYCGKFFITFSNLIQKVKLCIFIKQKVKYFKFFKFNFDDYGLYSSNKIIKYFETFWAVGHNGPNYQNENNQ